MERPNKIREEEYNILLPAEKALVKIAALIMCGRTFIPARLMAMTYGLRGRGLRSDTGQQRPVRNSPLSGVTGCVQQFRVVVGNEHTGNKDTENLLAGLRIRYRSKYASRS